MPRLYWKDMGSDVGHLSPVGLLILAPLSHWSRLAEQNLNCRLNPKPQRRSSLHHEKTEMPNRKSTGSSRSVFTPIGATVRVILWKMCHLICFSAGEIHTAPNAQHLLPTSPGCFSQHSGKKNKKKKSHRVFSLMYVVFSSFF